MLDKLLFAIRRSTVDLGSRLGSWRLSIVLMVVAGLYYGFLAIWATSSPPHVVQNIASLAPFWIVYGLLLVNTGVCLWNRLPVLRKELSRDSRWTALGTYIFHVAFFFLAAGFALTLLGRQEARFWVTVGETFESRPDQLLSASAPRALASGVPTLAFRVEEITPAFWRDELLFTTLEAKLLFPPDETATTRINRPLWVGPATFLRMSGFGFTPRYELLDRDGTILDSAFVKLNVFPPGLRDYFTLPDYPHRFYLEVMPDVTIEDGVPVNRSLNLTSPAVVLNVHRGRLDLGQAVLIGAQTFEFEGLRLRFPEIRHWGEFTIVRDPGAPVIFLGYLLGLAGLLLKIPGWGERPAAGMRRIDADD